MAKEDVMELEGVVEESMRNAVFQVKLENGIAYRPIWPGNCVCITYRCCPETMLRWKSPPMT